jgi:uncharacterized protein
MKYLILLLVVLAVVWFWRNGRSAAAPRPKPAKKAAPAVPQDMVQCPVCRVHLPRADALPGPDGQLYCCTEHRSRNG